MFLCSVEYRFTKVTCTTTLIRGAEFNIVDSESNNENVKLLTKILGIMGSTITHLIVSESY